MTTFEALRAPTNATDALFRLWGKWISDNLTSGGITKTSDTGQIDWTTVTAPASSGVSKGYEIRVLSDSLQATYPQYIKLEYGSAGNSSTPGMWITTGTGSDGAGNLTGFGAARIQVNWFSTSFSSSLFPWYMYVGASGFVICPAFGNVATNGILSWERTLDVSGAISGDGSCNAIGGNGFLFQVGHNQRDAAGINYNTNAGGGLLPRTGAYGLQSINGNIPFASQVGWTTRGIFYTQNLITCQGLVPGQIVYPSRFGVTRTYKVIGLSNYGPRGTTVDANVQVAMLWE